MWKLHFLRPYWLVAIIPLVFILFKLWRTIYQKNKWHRICDPHLLPHLLVKFGRGVKHFPLLALGLGWLIGVFALAGPTWKLQNLPIFQSHTAAIFILNLSESMNLSDISPSRLQRAKFKLLDLLKDRTSSETGLIVYSGEPHLLTPLTQDANTISNLVPVLSTDLMPMSGNNLSAALKMAEQLFKQTNATSGEIVLISDTVSDIEQVKSVIKDIRKENIAISVLNVNSIQDENLKQMAEEGNGIFVSVTPDNHDVATLKEKLDQQSHSGITPKKEEVQRWKDEGHLFVLFILPLALLFFRKGYL